MVVRQEVGARLKEERERLGHSQAVLAGLAHVSRNTQVAYEAGQTSPNLEYMASVAAVGIDVTYVLTGRPGAALAADEAVLLQRYRTATPELKAAALAVLGATPVPHVGATVASFAGDNRGNVAGTQQIDQMVFGAPDPPRKKHP